MLPCSPCVTRYEKPRSHWPAGQVCLVETRKGGGSRPFADAERLAPVGGFSLALKFPAHSGGSLASFRSATARRVASTVRPSVARRRVRRLGGGGMGGMDY